MSTDTYVMKDSGKRETFTAGAQRDSRAGKGRFDLISPIYQKRLAVWLELGAQKYEARNWERGINVSRSYDSAVRHLNDFLEGKTDEDHLAAAACNVMFMIHTLEMINRGILDSSFNDMPDYKMRLDKLVQVNIRYENKHPDEFTDYSSAQPLEVFELVTPGREVDEVDKYRLNKAADSGRWRLTLINNGRLYWNDWGETLFDAFYIDSENEKRGVYWRRAI